jgi:hypothetical protein
MDNRYMMKIVNFCLHFGLIILVVFFSSCRGRSVSDSRDRDQPAISNEESWELDREEQLWLEGKRSSGGLIAATVLFPDLFEIDDDGAPSGFHG